MNVVPNEHKLAELLLYIAKKLLDDPKGGAIKTNKILFAAEYASVRTFGAPITGVPYQKLRLGPAPRRLLPVREALLEDGSAELRVDWYMGKRLDRLVPLREPKTDLFTPEELALVDKSDQQPLGQDRHGGKRRVPPRDGLVYDRVGGKHPLRTRLLGPCL